MVGKEIEEKLREISGAYSIQTIFRDWVTVMALSISNSCSPKDAIWQTREDEYLQIIKKYNKKEIDVFAGCIGLLMLKFTADDALGEIYHRIQAKNTGLGQIFTPIHVAEMMAEITLPSPENGTISLGEPACGSGVMVLGAARVLQKRGVDYTDVLEVMAQDIDWICVYMTYIQLSLLGISAAVCQGDSLSQPIPDIKKTFLTPAYVRKYSSIEKGEKNGD